MRSQTNAYYFPCFQSTGLVCISFQFKPPASTLPLNAPAQCQVSSHLFQHKVQPRFFILFVHCQFPGNVSI